MGRNAELVRRFYDAWNRRAFGEVTLMLAPAVEWCDVARAETVRGREAVRALLASQADAFPSAHVEVLAAHEAGGVVVAEVSYTRTAGGRWPQRPTACEVIEVQGGLVQRARTYADAVRTALDLGADIDTSDVPIGATSRVA